MSDHEEREPMSPEHAHQLSRRTMLRLGLLAASAAPMLGREAHAQADKPGAHLVGKLEGPELVTDPAKYPKTFKEAPQFAELVKAGKLPPVEQRIGQDPLVIKPLREVGKYGGTWRRGFTGPFDTSNGHRTAQNDKLLYFDYTGTKIVPNIARGWEVSPTAASRRCSSAAACDGATASRSPPTTSSSGSRTCTATRSWCRRRCR